MISKLCIASTLATILTTVNGAKNHVLLIVADDQGFSDIGYRDSDFYTPTLDRLASTGIRLDRMYVESTCSPTRASLLTGKNINKLSLQDGAIIQGEGRTLPLNFQLLPQLLRDYKGYRTVGIGKWHLGQTLKADTPTERGFDEFFGNYQGGIDYFDHDVGYQCNSANPVDPDGLPANWGSNCYAINGVDINDNGKPLTQAEHAGLYYTDMLAAKAVEKIRAHDEEHHLFMYLAPTAPHAPLQATSEYFAHCAATPTMSDGSRKQILCAMMAGVDSVVSNVLDELEAKDMLKDTLIMYLSDNGGVNSFGSSNGGLRGQKGSLFEGGVRVPAFINYEQFHQSVIGTSYDGLFHVNDLFATIASYAGLPASVISQSDGKAFLQSNGKKRDNSFQRDAVVFGIGGPYLNNPGGVVLKDTDGHIYKYVVSPDSIAFAATFVDTYVPGIDDGAFLFDLTADPFETTNLATSIAANKRSAQLTGKFVVIHE
jgi:arylsulfatase A-like enzyme